MITLFKGTNNFRNHTLSRKCLVYNERTFKIKPIFKTNNEIKYKLKGPNNKIHKKSKPEIY